MTRRNFIKTSGLALMAATVPAMAIIEDKKENVVKKEIQAPRRGDLFISGDSIKYYDGEKWTFSIGSNGMMSAK